MTSGARRTRIGWKQSSRLMKWVVESSSAAVTRRSRKMATLRLSGGCHPTEGAGWRRWRLVSRRIVLF
ncbi:unnamed protein product [Spirodela intermedia]|uniref:Uncharacterized protein n=1 Tax=Spirodela intermedia TaxID=51605 RepID=A0A7I8JMR1_SPIIN|nr:unnamed protein product [Spirodela intermedia]CAA6670752.1 unnamed protein product [Spirodela intermedia]